jgi:hypothetical protein
MSRSGYSDDCENLALWRGRVMSATRGKRGQAFFRALLAALDAMPEKRLITSALQDEDGEVCAIGALGRFRGVDMINIDPEDPEQVASAFNVASCLAQEVEYMNDEYYERLFKNGSYRDCTAEERWAYMREWAAKQIRVRPDELQPSSAAGESLELLVEARNMLNDYQTQGLYNNDPVIELCERIDAYLNQPSCANGGK